MTQIGSMLKGDAINGCYFFRQISNDFYPLFFLICIVYPSLFHYLEREIQLYSIQ